jgi:hypothetical protein
MMGFDDDKGGYSSVTVERIWAGVSRIGVSYLKAEPVARSSYRRPG